LLESLTLTASMKNTKINLNYPLVDLDELSVQVTSGGLSRPTFSAWL